MTSSHPLAGVAPAQAFRAILFLEVVGPLQLAQRCGDEAGWEVLARIKQLTGPALQRGASVFNDFVDRCLASYETVPAAIAAAIAVQRAMAAEFEGDEKPARVRIGIHAGDVLESAPYLYGVNCYVANRVCSYAEGGEIMVTEAARSLAESGGITYNDHGDVLLQSFEEPVRIWDVHWKPALVAGGR